MRNKTMSGCSNPEAFERLVNSVKTKLYKTGMAILKNDDDTYDAIQNTLISSYKYFDTLKEEKYFKTWITRILINKCYDILKKKEKISYLNKEIEVNENTAYYDEYKIDSKVENALNTLDSDLRTTTILYYYDDFSVEEISDILNIPEGTVKSRLSRARGKLYNLLKEEGDNIG